MLHVLLWDLLRAHFERPWASALLLGLDFIIAVGFILLGSMSKPGRKEAQAYVLRQQVLRQGRDAIIIALLPATLMLGKGTARGGLALTRSVWNVVKGKNVKVLRSNN